MSNIFLTCIYKEECKKKCSEPLHGEEQQVTTVTKRVYLRHTLYHMLETELRSLVSLEQVVIGYTHL